MPYLLALFPVLVVGAFLSYLFILSNSNHTGMEFLDIVHPLWICALISICIGLFKKDRRYLIPFAISTLAALFFLGVDKFNIMVEYDEWVRRGMPSAFEESHRRREKKPLLKNVDEFIESFRQGKGIFDIERDKSIEYLMIGSRPDPKALKILGDELATGTQDVRLHIIALLSRLSYLSTTQDIRNPEILALLAGPALSKTDKARDFAMEILSRSVASANLSPYGDTFTKALKEEPTENALLLVAKAKPPSAWEEVERLSQLPEWNTGSKRRVVRIARAALGDKKIEDEYIAKAAQEEHAGHVKKMIKTLSVLTKIGTRSSLQAVCQRMRTPLKYDDYPESYQESARVNIIEALKYAYPERTELVYHFKIVNDKDYIKVEQFCMQELGVSFEGVPRPAFFKVKGRPDNEAERQWWVDPARRSPDCKPPPGAVLPCDPPDTEDD